MSSFKGCLTNRLRCLHFIDDILKAIEAIERFVAQMELSDFQNDKKTIRAIERELEIIGEAVKKLPAELTQDYQEIPWKLIARMRDRLIHHYWETEGAGKKIVQYCAGFFFVFKT